MPDLDGVYPEQVGQPKRGQGNCPIGHHKYQAPVPAVHVRARDRPKEDLGQECDQGGRCQHGGRAGEFGEPPDESKLDYFAADQ